MSYNHELTTAEEQNFLCRGYNAYFKYGGIAQPSTQSNVEVIDGRAYVRLFNVNGILAVYRVSKAGRLRRLGSFPKALEPRHFD